VVGAGATHGQAAGGRSLDGTAAQPDAASGSGAGGYALEGGLWPVVQAPPPGNAAFGDGFE
jgi:hypothetical protein